MRRTETILDEIFEARQETLRREQAQTSFAQIEADLVGLPAGPATAFFDALKIACDRPKIIAEVKEASPSEGVIRDRFSLEEINQAYQAADNVVGISILTEQTFFQGSSDRLRFIAQNNPNDKSLLRKDFLSDPYQVAESRWLGAHAYLLVAALFEQQELAELVDAGRHYGIEPLVEVHSQEELDMVLGINARCIGANSRDLRDFSTDLTVHDLLRQLDDSYGRVAESAISTPRYLGEVATFSDAALIGTEFMRSANIPAAIEAISGPA